MCEHGSWGASIPSHLAAYSEIPRLVSSLQKQVPDAQVAFMTECVSNIDVDIRDCISRALNVQPIEMCPSLRCPVRRPRLCWLSWELPAVGHNTAEHAKKSGYFGFPAVQTRATHHRFDQSRIVSHSKLSPLPPFVPPFPREAPPRTPAGYEPCDWHTLQRWKKDSFKFPLYQYLWQNGLTNSETWWYLDADERERLLGFRADHSRPATSTSSKKWELDNARMRP